MNKPHKHAALIHAFADGAEIQFKDCAGDWNDIDKPTWCSNVEYRIKPRTLIKEGWVNIHKHSTYWAQTIIWESESEAQANRYIDCVATVKVEWEEVERIG